MPNTTQQENGQRGRLASLSRCNPERPVMTATFATSIDPTLCRYSDCRTAGGCVGVCSKPWRWGEQYGKDILADLNQLAHSQGCGALYRDVMQRAYTEISRLRIHGNK
jgi:hypothetical protein